MLPAHEWSPIIRFRLRVMEGWIGPPGNWPQSDGSLVEVVVFTQAMSRVSWGTLVTKAGPSWASWHDLEN